jgi:hypothetical protein
MIFVQPLKHHSGGSRRKIKERARPLMDLYEEIFQGRSFSEESGKIQNIHLPSIRNFAYFIAKCVLARKTAKNYLLMI